METIAIPFNGLTRNTEGFSYNIDGIGLTDKNLSDICKFTQVPETLLKVDKKYGTHTLTQVLTSLDTPGVEALVDDNNNVQILDPRSRFCSDDEFEGAIAKLGTDVKVESNGFGKTATVQVEDFNADFLGDLFTKSIKLDRLPQGGVALHMGLLRLACTNGLLITESQFSHLLRNSVLEDSLASVFKSDVNNFSLNEYFTKIFTNNGEWLPISVTDYLGMRTHLAKMTDEDTANLYFPTERIENCYSAQDIDIHKINKGLLNKLPAGLSYYQSFQTLTNAAKLVKDITLQDKIDIAKWATTSKLKSLKATDLKYDRIPEWSAKEISMRMGDTAFTLI